MIDNRTAPYGALLLRIVLAVCFFAHAGFKIFVATPTGAAQFFESLGLPGAVAYVVMIGEVLGGLALLMGIWTRVVALLVIPFPLGSIIWVHGKAGFYFDNPNGGWEYPAVWILALVALALIGDGAHALKTARQAG
jgi:putative oxidoreductase